MVSSTSNLYSRVSVCISLDFNWSKFYLRVLISIHDNDILVVTFTTKKKLISEQNFAMQSQLVAEMYHITTKQSYIKQLSCAQHRHCIEILLLHFRYTRHIGSIERKSCSCSNDRRSTAGSSGPTIRTTNATASHSCCGCFVLAVVSNNVRAAGNHADSADRESDHFIKFSSPTTFLYHVGSFGRSLSHSTSTGPKWTNIAPSCVGKHSPKHTAVPAIPTDSDA